MRGTRGNMKDSWGLLVDSNGCTDQRGPYGCRYLFKSFSCIDGRWKGLVCSFTYPATFAYTHALRLC